MCRKIDVTRRHPRGFALLIVMIAVAIAMLLYAIQMGTLFDPAGETAPAEIQERPWAWEHLLADADKTVKKPKAPRPLLTEEFAVGGSAQRTGQPRGQVRLTFGTDGRIAGTWQARFELEGKGHRFSAPAMAGNVSVKMAYEDQNGTDKTRLFFIAKGPYEHVTAAGETASREKGTAWITGWLRPDRTAEGYVTVTTDETWAMAFAFTAAPAAD